MNGLRMMLCNLFSRKSAISICVEIHTTATPVHRKELVVRLTDESDLFFLHTLRLSEEEFQRCHNIYHLFTLC